MCKFFFTKFYLILPHPGSKVKSYFTVVFPMVCPIKIILGEKIFSLSKTIIGKSQCAKELMGHNDKQRRNDKGLCQIILIKWQEKLHQT